MSLVGWKYRALMENTNFLSKIQYLWFDIPFSSLNFQKDGNTAQWVEFYMKQEPSMKTPVRATATLGSELAYFG